jgi:Tfp pilus assembly protein PilX
MINAYRPSRNNPRYQSGMMTTFTGVMILILLTLMMFFAIRVGVFEQRVSANESRQKLAFHVAESGISHAKELLEANSALVASMNELDSGAFGWLRNDTNGRWKSCAQWANTELGGLAALADPDANGVSDQDKEHPCFGGYDPAMRQFQYFYEDADGNRALVDTDIVLAR